MTRRPSATLRGPARPVRALIAYALAFAMVAGLILGGGAPSSCIVPLGDGPRRVVAGELVTDVILPTYDDVVVRAQAMQTAAHAFAAANDAASRDALRTAWRAARVPWKQTDAFRFGPTALEALAVAIDQVPVDPARIETELSGTATLDATYFATLGANKKGFHAIEYLLFSAEAIDDRRRAFLAGCADDLVTNAVQLRDAWRDQAARLAAPGAANEMFPTIKASIDALVNESVFQAELIADARLGKPVGTASGGVVDPALQESEPSDNSIDDMLHSLESIRNVYLGSRDGTDAGGIGELVAKQSPATDRRMHEALSFAHLAITSLPRPFTHALVDEKHTVLGAYMAVQELQQLYATEVVSTLGATLKFNDNDGD